MQGSPSGANYTKDKKFSIIGDAKAMTLFGSHLWSKGKKLVICEGEIDAMSVSQVQGHKWATVSLGHGAPSAVKTIKANWDYLMGFDELIIMMDSDDAGVKAAQDIAEALPVGKADSQTALQRCQRVSGAKQRA